MPTALSLIPAADLTAFAQCKNRADVERWLEVLAQYDSAARGDKTAVITRLCAEMACTSATFYRKLAQYQASGWRGLSPQYARKTGKKNEAFLSYVEALYMQHQRDTSGAEVQRALLSQWSLWRRTGDPSYRLPGYTSPPPPGPNGYPEGFSKKSISRMRPDRHALSLARRGAKTASTYLPSILKTRVGLHLGEVVFFDDQDSDLKVVAPGLSRKPMRPQGFACIDYFSGCFLSHATRFQIYDAEADVRRSLTQRDFVWFIVDYLLRIGYRADGTSFIFEHGTANGYNNRDIATLNGCSNFDDALALSTGGAVVVNRSGKFNSPVFSGMLFRPQSSGNYRFKSPLESMFNLLRNYSSGIAGQIGLNARSHGPEENYGLEKYTEQMLKVCETLPADLLQMMQFPLLTTHQFCQIESSIYDAINSRTEHALEGWAEMGHVVPLIRLAPTDAAPWLTPAEQSALPAEAQAMLPALFGHPHYSTMRSLSPWQVAQPRLGELKKIDEAAIPLLIPRQWARDVVINDKRELVLRDKLCGDEPFVYIARIRTAHGFETLRPGLLVRCYFNPARPDSMVICNQDWQYIGSVVRNTRLAFHDADSMMARLGERGAMAADLRAGVAHGLSGVAHARQRMQTNNKQLIARAGLRDLQADCPPVADHVPPVCNEADADPEDEFSDWVPDDFEDALAALPELPDIDF